MNTGCLSVRWRCNLAAFPNPGLLTASGSGVWLIRDLSQPDAAEQVAAEMLAPKRDGDVASSRCKTWVREPTCPPHAARRLDVRPG